MPYPGRLKGREREAVELRKQGLSEYKIAVRLDVYPNAIRALFKRLEKQAALQSATER